MTFLGNFYHSSSADCQEEGYSKPSYILWETWLATRRLCRLSDSPRAFCSQYHSKCRRHQILQSLGLHEELLVLVDKQDSSEGVSHGVDMINKRLG